MEIFRIDATNTHVLDRVAVDVFDYEISPQFLDPYLKRPGNVLFVAVAENQVVGQIRGIVHMQPDCASQLFVENLGITPVMKRQGIASKLMERLLQWGQNEGCTDFWLATESDNNEAIGFYQSQKLLETKVVMFANFVDD